MWLAGQLAASIEATGASAFLDVRDIAHGDEFKTRIREELPKCQELVALFTPWSRQRSWVRHEIGMADALRLRIVCVFYHVELADFSAADDGLGPLDGLNIVDLNSIDSYLKALSKRVRA
jgi:TIR domain